MIIYVDVDETICTTPEDRDYSKSTPIMENIEKINLLHSEGHEIVYWTARGTGSGLNWLPLTVSQFETWGVKYSQLKLGKPMYDKFICDKAVNSNDFFKNDDV